MASLDHTATSRPRAVARRRTDREASREHRFTQDRLSAYLDRELPERDAWRVHDHLSSCWQCRRELDQLRRVVAALRRLRTEPRSDPVVDALIMRM
jgi:anti-sigma factor RsiW